MKPITALTSLSLLKFFALILITTFSLIGLSPDEAQYWSWSQALDLGYYSKPPGISWQIFLTTSLFGSNEIGVRIGAMFIGSALSFAIFYLAKSATQSSKSAFFAAALFALSPMGFYLSFAATTDGGALLFLTLALCPIAKAIAEEKSPAYISVGIYIAMGALFKWTLFFLWPMLTIALYFFPILRTKKIFLAIAISLLGLLPSLYWNYSHEWATYKHVFATLFQGGGGKKGNFFAYLGAQIALFSPLFFFLLLLAGKKLFSVKERAIQFLALFMVAALLPLFLSFFKKMQPNWALYLYPPLFVLMGWIVVDQIRLFYWGVTLSLVMIISSFTLPFLQERGFPMLPYKINSYRQTMGVRKLQEILIGAGYNPTQDFLFADKYQNSSLLSFYGLAQERAYFFNLLGMRKNQFSYWPSIKKEKGKNGYFLVMENCKAEALAWYEREYQERLTPFFESVTCVEKRPLFHVHGEGVKHALLFHCLSYNGKMPEIVKKY